MDTADTVQFLFYFLEFLPTYNLFQLNLMNVFLNEEIQLRDSLFSSSSAWDDAADANTRPPKTGDWGTEEWGGAEEWRGDVSIPEILVTCNFNLGGERTHSKYP